MSTSGGDERFSLRWNDYQSALACAFESLRSNEEFVDVTLSCEGRRLPSHRMLLSACSPYFRDLLNANPCQHPIIIMRETRYEDLKCILEFMYQGEVSIEQRKLDSFLKTAESLRIRGLTQENESSMNTNHARDPVKREIIKYEESVPLSVSGQDKLGPSGRKRRRSPVASGSRQLNQQVKNSSQFKEEFVDLEEENEEGAQIEMGADGCMMSDLAGSNVEAAYDAEAEVYEEEYGDEIGILPNDSAGQAEYDNSDEHRYGGFHHCGVVFPDVESFNEHNAQCHFGDFICNFCFRVFGTNKSLRRHLAMHEGKTKCTICKKVFSRVDSLQSHLRSVHNVGYNKNRWISS